MTTVLLADDSNTIRAMLSALLGDVPEIEAVLLAEDGEIAIDLALTHRPEVVIMDVQMPKVNGIDASRQVLDAWPEARIILHTAYDAQDLDGSSDLGDAVTYMSKGQRPSVLIETVLKVATDD